MEKAPKGKYWKTVLGFTIAALSLGWNLLGCASSQGHGNQIIAPADMPDICRDINFNSADNGLKEECGVTTRNYKAYRNIPVHRNLLLPKNSQIVMTHGIMELRIEGFLPVPLPKDFQDRIEFDEKVRRQFLKSRYSYFELFPPKETRPDKLIKIDIPIAENQFVPVCYIVDKPRQNSQRKIGYARRLLPLDCKEWERRRILAENSN